jgi:hypothetical protein
MGAAADGAGDRASPLSSRRTEENVVIRQAISCDICGAEKKQTNHWFVACEVAGELRVSGWNSRMRQRVGTKHLCGQTCLHKLVDEFMARTIGGRVAAPPTERDPAVTRSEVDGSLTSPAAYKEAASSARMVTTVAAAATVSPRIAPGSPSVVPMQPRLVAQAPVTAVTVPALPDAAILAQAEEAPNYSSRRWRAEAWERERNRELRAGERRPEIARRRTGV